MLHHTIQYPKQQVNSSKMVCTRKRAGPPSRAVNVKCKIELKFSTLTRASPTKGLITWENVSPADRVGKSPDYLRYFSSGWNWNRKRTQARICRKTLLSWQFASSHACQSMIWKIGLDWATIVQKVKPEVSHLWRPYWSDHFSRCAIYFV